MTHILDWHNAGDVREPVRKAVETLGQGGIIAFPTETVYTLAVRAAIPEAVERLSQLAQSGPERPLALAVREEDALNWVPSMSAMGRRLARRCWPGPVTVAFKDVEHGRIRELAESVRSRVCPAGMLRLTCPAHEAMQYVLAQDGGPLVVSCAYRGGELPATAAADVSSSFGDTIDLVLDGGPCRFGQIATVVEVSGDTWRIEQPGVVSEALLRRQAAYWIVFVCTGNTCRSPLAEALCKKLLAERLHCTPAELPNHGFMVLSAGLAAMMGGAAADEAIAVANELGADLRTHRSRPFSAELAYQADCVIAMTQAHLDVLTTEFPDLRERSGLLDPEAQDVPDPIGCEETVYRECAGTIARLLESHLPRWLTPSL